MQLQPSPTVAKRFSPDTKISVYANKKKEYDSDADYKSDDGPCFDAVINEGIQEFEEESINDSNEGNTDTGVATNGAKVVLVSDDDINTMNVADMKALLIERGLAQSGNKKVLKERLK
jgi:SAP domain